MAKSIYTTFVSSLGLDDGNTPKSEPDFKERVTFRESTCERYSTYMQPTGVPRAVRVLRNPQQMELFPVQTVQVPNQIKRIWAKI